MHPADIVAAVRKRGTNLAALARSNGLSNSAIRYALKYPASRAEAVLSDFLGVAPAKLWPERYDARGQRHVRKAGLGPSRSISARPARSGQ